MNVTKTAILRLMLFSYWIKIIGFIHWIFVSNLNVSLCIKLVVYQFSLSWLYVETRICHTIELKPVTWATGTHSAERRPNGKATSQQYQSKPELQRHPGRSPGHQGGRPCKTKRRFIFLLAPHISAAISQHATAKWRDPRKSGQRHDTDCCDLLPVISLCRTAWLRANEIPYPKIY